MKTAKFISLGVLLSLIISCAPSVEKAIKYNDDITNQQTIISGKLEDLNDTYDNYIIEEMNAAHKDALKQVNKSIKALKKIEAFDNDTTFKTSALDLFHIYKNVLENEHKRIIELLMLPDDRYGQDEVKEFENLRNKSIEKIDVEVEKLIEIQEAFSKKYNFDIEAEE